MQKEKIEKFKIDIISDKDVRSFYEFLDKRSKDHKLFELDVVITGGLYPILEELEDGHKQEDNEIATVYALDDIGFSQQIHVGNNFICAEDICEEDQKHYSVSFNFSPFLKYPVLSKDTDEIYNLHWWEFIKTTDQNNRELHEFIEKSIEKSEQGSDDIPNYKELEFDFPYHIDHPEESKKWDIIRENTDSFYFPSKNVIIPNETGLYQTRELLNGKTIYNCCMVGIKGTFYFDEDEPKYLIEVSKQQLKLKNY